MLFDSILNFQYSLYSCAISESSAQLLKKLRKLRTGFVRLKKAFSCLCIENSIYLCTKCNDCNIGS